VLHSLSRFVAARRGAALVEFTFVAPILIMLMCGMAEFANAMRQYHVMEKGVRDAGRYLARTEMSGCAFNGTAVANARNLAITGRISGGSPLFPTWTDPNSVVATVPQCFDNSGGAYRGHANMPVIEVTASAPYADLGMLTVLGIDGLALTVSHQQLWIGE
jgi:Flp pilus assembly protein TadG